MLDIRLNSQSLRDILTSPPKISDQANGVCRVLEFETAYSDKLANFLGQPVELWYNGVRWFFGFMFRRGKTTDHKVTFKAYDPLFYFKRTPDDYYVKNKTATQGFEYLAEQVGVKVYQLANTEAVFDALYYSNSTPDKIAVDLLARTYKANARKFWFRYSPGVDDEGLYLYERVVPAKIWTFTVGVNLTSASIEESVEAACPVIKLVNRETGKTVYEVDNPALLQYGHQIHFEEIDKDKADTMEAYAKELLTKLSKVTTTMNIEGANPDKIMPQFFSGDIIYVEEELTGIIGGYYIRNVTQTFQSDNLVTVSAEIIEEPDIPEIQYQKAKEEETELANGGSGKRKRRGKKADKETDTNTGVQESPTYSEEMQRQIDKYGLKKGVHNMGADSSVDLLGLMRGGEKSTPGMRVIKVVTTEPSPYSFIFEGDKQAVDMTLFEMPVSMYPLRLADRIIVYPMVDTAASQRWAAIEKINGGITIGTMTGANSVQVEGIGRAYSGSELIVPPFIVRNNVRASDPHDGSHTFYVDGDLTPLQAGDVVSLGPTIVNGAIKYVVTNWHGKEG